MEICLGCGDSFPEETGPTHEYMLSSPACWRIFGDVLAREYSDRQYARLHRLTVDTYAVQHPGYDGPRERNSVGIHLSRLCLMFQHGWSVERANDAMLAITAKKKLYPWLTPPSGSAALTVRNVVAAQSAEEHLQQVQMWAEEVWQHWQEHHSTVNGWLRESGLIGPNSRKP